MKKSKGFSLIEVLITLGIIGVIAALTLPTLNTNVQKAQAGPALMKAINTLQNSLSLGMTQKSLRSLTNFSTQKDIFEDSEKGPLYATMDYYDPITESQPYYNYDSTTFDDISSNARIYTTKDGIDFILANDGENPIVEITGTEKLGFAIYIDVNGYAKAPNTLGRDTFKLVVDSKGYVIPYGGYEYAKYFSEDDTPLWKNDCKITEITDGAACTGSIIDNGGKVVYAY